jgi:hypothetical protein
MQRPLLHHALAEVPCPFVGWASYIVRRVKTHRELTSAASDLAGFCADKHRSPSLAFVALLDGQLEPGSPLELAADFHEFVELTMRAAGERCCSHQRLDDPRWRLTIAGTPLFALALSGCYARDHPRFLAGSSALVFQPEALFAYHGITSNAERERYTEIARQTFTRNGRRFFSHHHRGTPKALRFVLDSEGRGLRWWQVQQELRAPTDS